MSRFFSRIFRKLIAPPPPPAPRQPMRYFTPTPRDEPRISPPAYVPPQYVPPRRVPPPKPEPRSTAFVPAAAQLTLSDDMHVTTDMHVIDRPRLRSLGARLRVDGNLLLGGPSHAPHEVRRISLPALPEGLRVAGNLELRSCFRLQTLPTDFQVGRSLLIADCDALRELPAGLHVRGNLTIIGGRSLTALPAGLRVDGNFELAGTRITSLPADLHVGGSLLIHGRTRVASLPPTMHVGSDIVLRRSPIAEIPSGLRINRDLILPGSRRLKALPSPLTLNGSLDLSDCTALESLPAGLRIMGSASLFRCTNLRSLPEALYVNGTLDLTGCAALAQLPPRLEIGRGLAAGEDVARALQRPGRHIQRRGIIPALSVADCSNLTALPEDLRLHGPLDVAGSALRDLPQPLFDTRILWRGILVPSDVVFHPQRLNARRILDEPNTEIRRVMLERVGIDQVLYNSGARKVDTDADPGGARCLWQIERAGYRLLQCRCPSTARQYLLRVPLNVPTCRHAAAWLAGFENPDQYRPELET